jgi:hypothetical protein
MGILCSEPLYSIKLLSARNFSKKKQEKHQHLRLFRLEGDLDIYPTQVPILNVVWTAGEPGLINFTI